MHNVVDELYNDYVNVLEMQYIVYKLNMYVNEVLIELMDKKHQMVLKNFVYHVQQFHEIEYVEIMYHNMEIQVLN
jgi:hypothetical protein